MKPFNEKTFVCFIDIAGFKVALNENILSAGLMLDIFYSAGYQALKSYKSLNGIFVSDCGIIYCNKGSQSEKLIEILKAVRQINLKMLENNYLTTASIAFGHFEYKKKIAFDRITKNAIMGNGYLNAFQDNENREYKIYPGQVRITKKIDQENNENIFDKLNYNNPTLKFLEDTNNHFYFHWYSNKSSLEAKLASNQVFSNFLNNENRNYETLKRDLKLLKRQ